MTVDEAIRARLHQIDTVDSGAPDFMLTMGVNYGQMCHALGAVLDLHFDSGGGYCATCSSWEEGIELPCSTLQSIAIALGVET